MPEDVWSAAAEMKEYVIAAIDERRRQPRDDLLTTIARSDLRTVGWKQTRWMKSSRILLVAGIHTTSTLLSLTRSSCLPRFQTSDVYWRRGLIASRLRSKSSFHKNRRCNGLDERQRVTTSSTARPSRKEIG